MNIKGRAFRQLALGIIEKGARFKKIASKVLLVVIPVGLLMWAVYQGYSIAWTGFGDFTKPNSDFVRGKTLWDWMQLFLIPIMLSLGVFYLNRAERISEREIATDRQQEAALQTYLDRMADLLLKEDLRSTKKQEVRDVARIRTLTALRVLDTRRKLTVLFFLNASGLIGEKPIISLAGVDLSNEKLAGIRLNKANLGGVDLSDAKLFGADLKETKLKGANLFRADLRKADLRNVDLREANLYDADLRFADFSGANLSGARLPDEIAENPKYVVLNAFHFRGTIMPDGSKRPE